MRSGFSSSTSNCESFPVPGFVNALVRAQKKVRTTKSRCIQKRSIAMDSELKRTGVHLDIAAFRFHAKAGGWWRLRRAGVAQPVHSTALRRNVGEEVHVNPLDGSNLCLSVIPPSIHYAEGGGNHLAFRIVEPQLGSLAHYSARQWHAEGNGFGLARYTCCFLYGDRYIEGLGIQAGPPKGRDKKSSHNQLGY